MSKDETPIDIVGLRERLSKLTYDKLKEEAEVLGVSEVWKGGVNKQTAVENIIKAYVAKTVKENSTKIEEVPASEVPGAEPETPVNSNEEIPEGEYDVDEETLIEFPALIEMGFSIGDVLVVEEGKPWSKKEVVLEKEVINSFEEYLTSNLRRQSYIDNPSFPSQELLEERLSKVNDADRSKWEEYVRVNNLDLVNGITREKINEELSNLNGGPAPVEEKGEEKPVEEIEVEDEQEETGEYVPEVIDESKFTEEELQENIDICQANCNQALPATRIFLLRKIDALQLALERKQK